MNRKKAITAFSIISVFKFVLGAVVVVLLLSLVWTFLSPQKTAEASTLKAFDDIIVKMDTNAFEAGQTVIAYGYIDKNAAIIGFNSGDAKTGEIVRPPQCGSHLNSCICAYKVKYEGLRFTVKAEKVIACKGFPSREISGFNWGSGGLKIKSNVLGTTVTEDTVKSGPLMILGRDGGGFTLTIQLSDKNANFWGEIEYV